MIRLLVLFVALSSLFVSGCLVAQRMGLQKTVQEQMQQERLCLEEFKSNDFWEKIDNNPAYAEWIVKKCPEFLDFLKEKKDASAQNHP